jgi:hypothetical protein
VQLALIDNRLVVDERVVWTFEEKEGSPQHKQGCQNRCPMVKITIQTSAFNVRTSVSIRGYLMDTVLSVDMFLPICADGPRQRGQLNASARTSLRVARTVVRMDTGKRLRGRSFGIWTGKGRGRGREGIKGGASSPFPYFQTLPVE